MKRKTIDKKIATKIKDWLSTLPENLAKEVKDKVVVTGGCIASMLLGERVNDYDIYLKDIQSAYKLAQHYANKFIADNPEAQVQPLLRVTLSDPNLPQAVRDSMVGADVKFYLGGKDEDGTPYSGTGLNQIVMPPDCKTAELMKSYPTYIERVEVFVKSAGVAGETKNDEPDYEYFEMSQEQNGDDYAESQIAGGDDDGAADTGSKYRVRYLSSNAITLANSIQIIIRFVGEPEEIHENYDFVHATNFWTAKTKTVLKKEALEALITRELIYFGSKYPLASLFRLKKFVQRGWSSHVGNTIKMALQLNELDLNNIHVLEDQLTGMDMAYMMEIIRTVKDHQKRNPNFEFNATYLCSVVDRLMGR